MKTTRLLPWAKRDEFFSWRRPASQLHSFLLHPFPLDSTAHSREEKALVGSKQCECGQVCPTGDKGDWKYDVPPLSAGERRLSFIHNVGRFAGSNVLCMCRRGALLPTYIFGNSLSIPIAPGHVHKRSSPPESPTGNTRTRVECVTTRLTCGCDDSLHYSGGAALYKVTCGCDAREMHFHT